MIWNSRSARLMQLLLQFLLEFLLLRSGLGMLTGCCQQAFSITGQHFDRRGFPMMFSRSFAVHAPFAPLCRVQAHIQAWALEHIAASSPSGDLRLMLADLALR